MPLQAVAAAGLCGDAEVWYAKVKPISGGGTMRGLVVLTALLGGVFLMSSATPARAGGCNFGTSVLTNSLEECAFSCSGNQFVGTANLSGFGASIVMFCEQTFGGASCQVAGSGTATGLSCGDTGQFQTSESATPPVSCLCEVNRASPVPAAVILSAGCSCS
jgi:hypothetical protein